MRDASRLSLYELILFAVWAVMALLHKFCSYVFDCVDRALKDWLREVFGGEQEVDGVNNYLAAAEIRDPLGVSCGYGQFRSEGLHCGPTEIDE
jgi:hypothetical protein